MKISGSIAKRGINCTASIEFNSKRSSIASFEAIEGTNAHALAEKCLVSNTNTEMSSSMEAYVQEYINFVRKIKRKNPHGIFGVEEPLKLDTLPIPVTGVVDAYILSPFDKLHVFDLKYGQWVEVYAYENDQLLLYALSILGRHNKWDVQEVSLHISQPRLDDNKRKTWTINVDELYQWQDEKLIPALEAIRERKTEFKMGDWCQFCKGRDDGSCPEMAKQALLIVDPLSKVQFPPIEQLSNTALAGLLRFITHFSKWMKPAKGEAIQRAMNGTDIPGFSLRKSSGRRRIDHEDQFIRTFHSIYGDKIFKPKTLRSIKELEEFMKKEELSEFITKPDLGYTITASRKDKIKDEEVTYFPPLN